MYFGEVTIPLSLFAGFYGLVNLLFPFQMFFKTQLMLAVWCDWCHLSHIIFRK